MSQDEVVGFIFETTGPKSDETFKFHSIKKEDCIKIGRNILFQLGQVDADTVSREAEGFNAQIRFFFALIHFCCVLVTLSDLGSSRGFCLLQQKEKRGKILHTDVSSVLPLEGNYLLEVHHQHLFDMYRTFL